MLNPKTKKVIVGSTSSTIYDRFKKHLTGRTDNLSHRAAHYITNLGIEKWIILPLEYHYNNSTLTRYQSEGKWANFFRNHLINNPIQLHQFKPTKKPMHNIKKQTRDQLRLTQRNQHFTNWKSYFYIILQTNIWKDWHELPLINLLININKLRVIGNSKDLLTYTIRNHLRTKFNLTLKPTYDITLPYSKINIIPKIQQWIKNNIIANSPSAYYLYVASHLRIIQHSPIKLKNLISNLKTTLKDFRHLTNNSQCKCHLYPDLISPNIGHINIKALDLPPQYNHLKKILTLSSKTPIPLQHNMFLGITYDSIRKLSTTTHFQLKWSQESNTDYLEF
jgi:hypothetical protein